MNAFRLERRVGNEMFYLAFVLRRAVTIALVLGLLSLLALLLVLPLLFTMITL
jgi:hypothetical protein